MSLILLIFLLIKLLLGLGFLDLDKSRRATESTVPTIERPSTRFFFGLLPSVSSGGEDTSVAVVAFVECWDFRDVNNGVLLASA